MRCGGAHPVRGKMPAFMRKSLLLSALLLISGCDIASTMRGAIDSWKGAPLEAAVHQWGEPTQEYSRSGARTLTWTRVIGGVLPAQSFGTIGPGIGGARTIQMTTMPAVPVAGWCSVHLLVDENNTITGGRYSGNDCCFNTLAGYCGNLPRK